MAATLSAMSISGGILLVVVVLVVLVSMATVKRGTKAMEDDSKRH